MKKKEAPTYPYCQTKDREYLDLFEREGIKVVAEGEGKERNQGGQGGWSSGEKGRDRWRERDPPHKASSSRSGVHTEGSKR